MFEGPRDFFLVPIGDFAPLYSSHTTFSALEMILMSSKSKEWGGYELLIVVWFEANGQLKLLAVTISKTTQADGF